jgi:hypothetical protein
MSAFVQQRLRQVLGWGRVAGGVGWGRAAGGVGWRVGRAGEETDWSSPESHQRPPAARRVARQVEEVGQGPGFSTRWLFGGGVGLRTRWLSGAGVVCVERVCWVGKRGKLNRNLCNPGGAGRGLGVDGRELGGVENVLVDGYP